MQWKLFADLAEITEQRQVTVDVATDATVGDALDALVAAYPELEERILTEDGRLQPHVSVLQNGTHVAELDRPTEGDDELALLPPVSGG